MKQQFFPEAKHHCYGWTNKHTNQWHNILVGGKNTRHKRQSESHACLAMLVRSQVNGAVLSCVVPLPLYTVPASAECLQS